MKILFTTPIYYPNDKMHLGSAHTSILTQALANLMKFSNPKSDVCLLTGVDEHGNKVLQSANSQNLHDYLDKRAEEFKKTSDLLGIKYSRFIRTTDLDHVERVKIYWNKLLEKGFIYKGTYSGYYSQSEESFLTEREAELSKTNLEYLTQECYYFAASKLSHKLNLWLKTNPIYPTNFANYVESMLKDGLKDLCVSRKGGWGIEVPSASGDVIYVWFDALLNYLSLGENIPLINVVGKDILKFHAIYWPVLLMALDLEPPKKIIVHNWWLFQNEKMSKSKKNTLNPKELVENYGLLPLTFYVLMNPLLQDDMNFDEKKMIEQFNSFFVNKFSNLVYRVLCLARKFNVQPSGAFNEEIHNKLLQNAKNLDIEAYMHNLFYFCDYLNALIESQSLWKGHMENISNMISYVNQIKNYFKVIFDFDIHADLIATRIRKTNITVNVNPII